MNVEIISILSAYQKIHIPRLNVLVEGKSKLHRRDFGLDIKLIVCYLLGKKGEYRGYCECQKGYPGIGCP